MIPEAFRIVAWNCAGKFAHNADKLAALDADICIVPEVLEPQSTMLGDRYAGHWDGEKGKRGLLIAAKKDWRLDLVKTVQRRHMVLLAAHRGGVSVSVIGVWAMRGPQGYVGEVIEGLDTLLPLVEGVPNVFVAGDFNASPAFDATVPIQFAEISRRLQKCGLTSLWHERSGETFGQETSPTYHHQWKLNQPFHIDFAFVSKGLAERCRGFEIGKFDNWNSASDHMPLIADFE
ncbi:MAG: hypothetical protein NW206_02135 [Hyphomonadaceae bacterium]|nr:hypothetical protein [Hyphomonadaceae bacterium]